MDKIYDLKLISGEEIVIKAEKTDEGFVITDKNNLPLKATVLGQQIVFGPFMLFNENIELFPNDLIMFEAEITDENIINYYSDVCKQLKQATIVSETNNVELLKERARKSGLVV